MTENKKSLRCGVFLASHIRYSGQFALLKEAIGSVVTQCAYNPEHRYKINLFLHVSVSYEKYVNISDNNDVLKSMFQVQYRPKQLYQMEHIELLFTEHGYKYDMIMFLDDDDTYNRSRLYNFESAMREALAQCRSTPELACVRECLNHNEFSEYWAYGITPQRLRAFFIEVKKWKLQKFVYHPIGDTVFRTYMRLLPNLWTAELTGKRFYNYNKNNPAGSCNSKYYLQNKRIEEMLHSNAIAEACFACVQRDDRPHFTPQKLAERLKRLCDADEYVKKTAQNAQPLLDFYNAVQTGI